MSSIGGHGQGVKSVGSEVSIDWLTLTAAFPETLAGRYPGELRELRVREWVGREFLPFWLGLSDKRTREGRRYDERFQLVPAGMVAWHSRRAEWRVMVDLSGAALARLRAVDNCSQGEMLTWALSHRVTRLDLALDWYGEGRALDVLGAYRGGQVETRVHRQSVTLFRSETPDGVEDDTVYMGGKQSEKRLRVYDKGVKEWGRRGWVRVELQLRRGYAAAAAAAILDYGLRETVPAAVRGFVDCPTVAWWASAMGGVTAERYAAPQGLRSNWHWYERAVLPSLRRDLAGRDGARLETALLQILSERGGVMDG